MIRLPSRSRYIAYRTYNDLPVDLLSPILTQLSDRRDWHACALVSKAFNKAATPLLYRKLDSRIISKVTLIFYGILMFARPRQRWTSGIGTNLAPLNPFLCQLA